MDKKSIENFYVLTEVFKCGHKYHHIAVYNIIQKIKQVSIFIDIFLSTKED